MGDSASDIEGFKDENGQAGSIIAVSVDDFNDDGTLKNFSDVNCVIFFYGDWCGHCKNTKPAYAKFSNLIKNTNSRALIVNSDKNKPLFKKINPKVWGYEINGFPTIVGYSKGKFYSEYGFDSDNRDKFRSAEDFVDFANGLGTASVEWM